MSDLSKLLNGAQDGASFLQQLDLQPPEKTQLVEARDLVKATLIGTFSSASAQVLGAAVAPRFYTQGSYAYRTINRPAFPPKQQKDLDYGMYLPLDFMKEARPSQAADVYFKFVDQILEGLCVKQGWTFAKRPTCARMVIGRDAHLDVPLYAIPQVQFVTLAKAAVRDSVLAEDGEIDFMNARRGRPDSWDVLPSDQVLLAHREEDWKVSDPRKIHEWFLSAVDTFGEQFRRVCRYLKAWRDQQGEAIAGLSSICLMVCAFEVYRTESSLIPSRDDLALLHVARRLPRLLEGPVCNPTDDSEKLCAKLSREERQRAMALAGSLVSDLDAAVKATDAHRCITLLRQSLGDRVPLRPDLVAADQMTVAAVRQHQPTVVAAPVVGRRISG
jgi:hypothetical protein